MSAYVTGKLEEIGKAMGGKQLQDFHSGRRKHAVMQPMAYATVRPARLEP